MTGIFNNIGVIEQHDVPVDGDAYFVTFYDDLNAILCGTAPATGVSVVQKVDYNITKGMTGDFLAAAFGDMPIPLVITGLQIYRATPGCADNSKDTTSSVSAFYSRNKFSVDNTKRITMSLKAAKDGEVEVYTCVLLELTMTGSGKGTESGYYEYSMSLVGVKGVPA